MDLYYAFVEIILSGMFLSWMIHLQNVKKMLQTANSLYFLFFAQSDAESFSFKVGSNNSMSDRDL